VCRSDTAESCRPIECKHRCREMLFSRRRFKQRIIFTPRSNLGRTVRYVTLLGPPSIAMVKSTLGGVGTTCAVRTLSELIRKLKEPQESCVILDPALLSSVAAEEVAKNTAQLPCHLVLYASITPRSLEASVILARKTNAQFVFSGAPDEKQALARALLPPDVETGVHLLAALHSQVELLPQPLRNTVSTLLTTGTGPLTPNALARQSTLSRRTMDRQLAQAGFASSRLLIASAHIFRVLPAITCSTVPFRRVAIMLGYSTQRSLNRQLYALFNCTSSQLRSAPILPSVAASLAAQKLTSSSNRFDHDNNRPDRNSRAVRVSSHLKSCSRNP